MEQDFQIGDEVIIAVDNVQVHGVVESIQVKANLIDVKIYEPGHRSHCLIVARPPEQVAHDNKGKAQTA